MHGGSQGFESPQLHQPQFSRFQPLFSEATVRFAQFHIPSKSETLSVIGCSFWFCKTDLARVDIRACDLGDANGVRDVLDSRFRGNDGGEDFTEAGILSESGFTGL